jgi:hypothetical protein
LNQERVVQEILKHRDFSNLVMVTHDLNISDVVLEDTVPMGEFFVVQPRGAVILSASPAPQRTSVRRLFPSVHPSFVSALRNAVT